MEPDISTLHNPDILILQRQVLTRALTLHRVRHTIDALWGSAARTSVAPAVTAAVCVRVRARLLAQGAR